MSFDFIYSILPRRLLAPKDLVYRRRVSKSAAGEQSKALPGEEKDDGERSATTLPSATMPGRKHKIDEVV